MQTQGRRGPNRQPRAHQRKIQESSRLDKSRLKVGKSAVLLNLSPVEMRSVVSCSVVTCRVGPTIEICVSFDVFRWRRVVLCRVVTLLSFAPYAKAWIVDLFHPFFWHLLPRASLLCFTGLIRTLQLQAKSSVRSRLSS